MFSLSAQPLADLSTTRHQNRSEQTRCGVYMEAYIAVAQSRRCAHVFLKAMVQRARSVAAIPLHRQQALCGLAVPGKDLFDNRGQVTTAGSTALVGNAPATQDCFAAVRLRTSGGAIIGRTYTVEFAFSGVAINLHFGTPSIADGMDGPCIPGGSSSDAAVSVATGAAHVGLGSDTGGSVRSPAALNGSAGFKDTARLVPTADAIALFATLDTVSALTRSVTDAIVAHEGLAARVITKSVAPLRTYRLAVPRTTKPDGPDDATVARAWQRALEQVRTHGVQVQEIDLAELAELSSINASGDFRLPKATHPIGGGCTGTRPRTTRASPPDWSGCIHERLRLC